MYKGVSNEEIFKEIEIRTNPSRLNFLIEEALSVNSLYRKNGSLLLKIDSSVSSSYGVITKENEITRYSVTLNVKYELKDKKTENVYLKGKEVATTDYSAAVTYSGFATEVAKRDTYKRLAENIAERINTKIIIWFKSRQS